MTATSGIDQSYRDEPVEATVISSEEEALAAAVQFADRIRQTAAARDATATRPSEEISELRRTGLLGLTVPRDYGGIATSTRTLVEVFRVISAADPSIGQIPQNHFSHLDNVWSLGTPEQKAFFADEILAGAMLGNALSERGVIGGLPNFKTRLREAGDGSYILSGRKYYATGALFAQWLPVTALDEERRPHVAHVRSSAPGVAIIDDWNSMGQRGTASGTVILDDVPVKRDHVFPTWRYGTEPNTRLPFGQIMHVALDVGIAEEALADTVAFVTERSRPWHGADLERAGDDPHTIYRIGEMKVQLEAARRLLLHSADTVDRIRSAPTTPEGAVEASMAVAIAKAAASVACVEISNELFALAGTSATDEKYNLHRHWRNARTHTLHDPERWKFHYIGDWVLNGRVPPRNALI